MSTKSKVLLTLAVVLAVLALVEQTKTLEVYSSRLLSTTQTSDSTKASAGDLISTVRVEKPMLRWLPFIKYGETVYRHTYQNAAASTVVIERDATTRTRLLVVGLCSTSKYEELASAPFQEVHAKYNDR